MQQVPGIHSNKNKLTDNNTVLSAYFFIIYPKSG